MKMPDLDAEHYRKHSSFQYQVGQELLEEISFKGNETILDIGCGEGRITAELAHKVPQGSILGIDPSAQMITLARNSFSRKDLPNLHFQHASAETFQCDKPADMAFILNALHWIRDPKKALRNIHQALKPDGALFIVTYPKESPYWHFLQCSLEKAQLHSYLPLSAIPSTLSTAGYSKLLQEEGFTANHCSLEEKVATYETPQTLRDYIKGWLQSFVPLPAPLETRFLEAAGNLALEQYWNKENTTIFLPYSKLVIKAKTCYTLTKN